MPIQPARPCNQQGCGELITVGSRCEKHKRESAKGFDLYRGSSTQRGYGGPWPKLRLRALQRDDYLCQPCLLETGRMVPATDVDHIKRFSGLHDPLRLDITNLVSMCHACHSRKTMQQDGGGGHVKKTINK